MKRITACMLPLLAGVLSVSVMAADVTGVWKGQATDPQGNPHDLVFSLKADGAKLTGTVTAPPDPEVKEVLNGRIAGDSIFFEISSESRGGNAQRIAIAARVTGNRMQGSVTQRGDKFGFTLTKVSATPAAPVAPSVAGAAGTHPPDLQGRDPQPVDAQTAILAAFDRYAIVGGLGVTNKEPDDFILTLIRNPAFPDKVNDIAVECGNSLYQPILDRYLAGEDVPFAEVRAVWRNTTQPMCGFSTFYEELVPLVRRINDRLPPQKKLRILACDPPIDWSRVRSAEDLRPFMDRDKNIAAVIETEVLAKHRKALMPFGINHMRHGTSAMGRIERDYPNVTLVVADYQGFSESGPLAPHSPQLDKLLASWPVPSLVTIKGSWLADGYPGVDALLYFGPRDLLLQEPISARVALDQAYMAELQRRVLIRGGADGPSSPKAILQREAQAGVFLHERPRGTP